METTVNIIGAGLAGSEAALQLASRGIPVRLFEMRPVRMTEVHKTGLCSELVCSNSLKSDNPCSAAGMLKKELEDLGSFLLAEARRFRVDAGGALAVDRDAFAEAVTTRIEGQPLIRLVRTEVEGLPDEGAATIIASGPLTSAGLARSIEGLTGSQHLSFYDAAAPIVMADSLDHSRLFRQSRYESGPGDYLNAPFTKAEYERFIEELVSAQRTILKEFETGDLFQACQPVEEIARKGADAPRFGAMKPVGLSDPKTGRRPWAALQLRAENPEGTSYNLVGFQTNLTFAEQQRVFRMIPGLEHAEFARYGVMHRNTFLDAPRLLDAGLRLKAGGPGNQPLFVAGQLAGTEGYCEAMMSGLHAALSVAAYVGRTTLPPLPRTTAFGSLLSWAVDEQTVDYQPMHVNFGIIEPLAVKIRNKKDRYRAYAERGRAAMAGYVEDLREAGLLDGVGGGGKDGR